MSKSLTYSSYLMLDELLELQQPKSDPPEHDEMLFIVIHQVYELWFKLLLHELEKIGEDLSAGSHFRAIATFKRIRMVMKTLVAQLDILETMSPMSFMAFRDRLEAASGFQSPQFREMEFMLGFKRPEMVEHHQGNPTAVTRLQARLAQPSVVDRFYDFLELHEVEIPAELRNKPPEAANLPNATVQEGILHLYRTQPDIAILFELMTDFDEGLQEWRYRHVKMVERTIGRKPGTGGSPGVAFLRSSLFNPVFPDLWAIRDRL
jgi:tryptophan 2,3-dioxygenase